MIYKHFFNATRCDGRRKPGGRPVAGLSIVCYRSFSKTVLVHHRISLAAAMSKMLQFYEVMGCQRTVSSSKLKLSILLSQYPVT